MPKFDVDGDLVRKLAALLDETGLVELEFASGENRIRVVRSTGAAADKLSPSSCCHRRPYSPTCQPWPVSLWMLPSSQSSVSMSCCSSCGPLTCASGIPWYWDSGGSSTPGSSFRRRRSSSR